MGRIHAFELEDQPWFPPLLRDAGMAFLRAGANWTGQARAIRPVIERALERSGEDHILDLCSGGGGPIVSVARELRDSGRSLTVTMTDLYPSASGRAAALSADNQSLTYDSSPVDATAVAPNRPGLRTLFNAFHHFRPAAATKILGSAVAGRRSIAVVEVVQRSPVTVIGMLLVPLIVLATVPLLRPFRWQWIPLTYILPLIPLFIWWDGTISALRAYRRNELLALAGRADPEGVMEWSVEEIPVPSQPIAGLALLGIPKSPASRG